MQQQYLYRSFNGPINQLLQKYSDELETGYYDSSDKKITKATSYFAENDDSAFSFAFNSNQSTTFTKTINYQAKLGQRLLKKTFTKELQMPYSFSKTSYSKAGFIKKVDPKEEYKLQTQKNYFDKLKKSPYNSVIEFMDKSSEETVGQDAVIKYFESYKNIKKIKEQNQYFQKKSSIMSNMCEELEDLQPRRLGIIKSDGPKTKINLANFNIGKAYCSSLPKILNKIDNISELNINLSRSGMNAEKTESFFKTLKVSPKVLNLSHNRIGRRGVNEFAKFITSGNCKIQEINEEGNVLGDILSSKILQGLLINPNIKIVNFSNNKLTDASAKLIKEVIRRNPSLSELYLH